MVFLGVLAFGGVFSGTNSSHTAFELAHAFKTADVKGLLVEPELLPNALRAAKEVGIPFSRVFVFDHQTSLSIPYDGKQTWSVTSNLKGSVGELKSWRSLMQHGERPWEPWNDEERSKHTTAARLFSSGTTGLPKAVELSHHNLITQHTLVYDYKPRDYEVSAFPPRCFPPMLTNVVGVATHLHAPLPHVQRSPRVHLPPPLQLKDLHHAPLRPRTLPRQHATLPDHRAQHGPAHGHPDHQLSHLTQVLSPSRAIRLVRRRTSSRRAAGADESAAESRCGVQPGVGHERNELHRDHGVLSRA